MNLAFTGRDEPILVLHRKRSQEEKEPWRSSPNNRCVRRVWKRWVYCKSTDQIAVDLGLCNGREIHFFKRRSKA